MARIPFKSRKDPLFGVVILGTALTMLFVLAAELDRIGQPGNEVQILGLIILGLAMGLMLWLWFDTGYSIDNVFIYFRSGPFRGKLRISSIREVVVGTTMWSGFKPALARKGMIVKYNRYDEIYLSPDSNEAFVAALLDANPEIQITGKKMP
ncbi:PH domain-containing protein [Parapedobacter koreensis]|uniref:PH domain-containing protein n=1 Tax=Parapedobacter koreensis TaxID=332977 RepID=A0A1H7P413_9SPHI|nr:PH domain-containing protein [Parapedobacter koreensis]SEL30005.1 PH domain-containing protein [Parapedobacter koreensis]